MSATEGNHGPPPPEEPKTPMWLPALGAALFLTVGLVWGLSSSSKDSGQPGGAAPSATPATDAGARAPRHP